MQQGRNADNMRDCREIPGRLMGLDLGTRFVGLAITDPLRIMSRPLTTLKRTRPEQDTRRIVELIRQYEVVKLVAGLPRHLDGRPAEILSKIEPLARQIEQQSGLPLVWAEERLSSKEAERLMAEMGCSLSERRRRRDEFAAALILRWYLDEEADGFHAETQRRREAERRRD